MNPIWSVAFGLAALVLLAVALMVLRIYRQVSSLSAAVSRLSALVASPTSAVPPASGSSHASVGMGAATPPSMSHDGITMGSVLPSFSVRSQAGTALTLSPEASRVRLIVFTLSGCAGCEALYPEIKSLEQCDQVAGYDLLIIMGSGGPPALQDLHEKWKFHARMFLATARDSMPRVFPFGVVVDAAGVVRAAEVLSREGLARMVELARSIGQTTKPATIVPYLQ